MPVAPQVGRLDGHYDVVAGSDRDGPVAVGTDVVLGGQVGLDEAHLHLAEALRFVHSRLSQECPDNQADSHQQSRDYEDEVGASAAMGTGGIESHGASIV